MPGKKKTGRNDLCPCGSGKKYKKCCLDVSKTQHSGKIRSWNSLPPQIQVALEQHEAQELIRTQQQGLGKPIISTTIGDHRIVGVGSTVYGSNKWRFFSDFLFDYIKKIIGSDWGQTESAKPLEERHPIMQWYDSFCRFQNSQPKQPDGTYSAIVTEVVACYLGLAYNLYLLKHNAELQKRLVNRLKNREQFQGAYYELIVANCLIRAGFELTLEDETDESSKHCEFSAVSKHTGKKYWVEAKMRAVSGMLGKTDADGSSHTSKPTSKLTDHLRSALRKPAKDERLIFIDVNAPPISESELGSETPKMTKWLEAACKQLDDREKDLKDGEQAYVFVTNIPFHRSLDSEARGHVVLAHGLGISDFSKPGHYRLREIWNQKQKHIDAHHIMEAFQSYPKWPPTFDGSLPLAKSDAENRIQIGETYLFEDGENKWILGKVTTATISERERKMYIGMTTEDGKAHIRTRDISDAELACYKEYPDAYFGVVQKVPRKRNDPKELFEWMVSCYQKTPKERLLELCKDHPNLENLKKLSHMDLVLEICEQWTTSILAQNRNS